MNMKIGLKIRNIREDADLSQEQIASMIPMNQSNYSKIERDVQEPSIYQLKRIAEILHIDLNELFELTDFSHQYDRDLRFARTIKCLYQEIYEESDLTEK